MLLATKCTLEKYTTKLWKDSHKSIHNVLSMFVVSPHSLLWGTCGLRVMGWTLLSSDQVLREKSLYSCPILAGEDTIRRSHP